MIAILSPAKNMKKGGPPLSTPVFRTQAMRLAHSLKKLAPFELESLYKVSPQLGLKAYLDMQSFDFDTPVSSAATSYNGLAFTQLGAKNFTQQDMDFAQDHLRILSALYGVLRPGDGICPYRLQMQCKLCVDGGNLYSFWANSLFNQLTKTHKVIINLASDEYAKAVLPYCGPDITVIDINFVTVKQGRQSVQATYAKMARGAMAKYMVVNRLQNPTDLQNFTDLGFCFEPKLSTPTKYTFLRSATAHKEKV